MDKLNFMGVGPKIGMIALPWLAVSIILTVFLDSTLAFFKNGNNILFYIGLALIITGGVMYFLSALTLLKGLKKTFLVTNGTLPPRLSKLSQEPSQLYVSLCAPNEEVYNSVCRPQFPSAWSKLNETLSMLQNFRCPTAVRMTMVKDHNMNLISQYAKIVEKANPTYIEVKAYMHIGFSNLRLGFDQMPMHQEVKDFAIKLAAESGYRLINEAPESRVVLLSRLDRPIQVGIN